MARTTLFKQHVSIQAILYILQQLGGVCDIHKCNKILYFADNEQLSKFGHSITGDDYYKMDYGPVPTCIYDLMKAVRGDSYFANQVDIDNIRNNYFHFRNNREIVATAKPDMDYLSESDIEALDHAIEDLRDKNFDEVTKASHGYAWINTAQNQEISIKARLTECGDTDEYIDYVEEMLAAEKALV